jgi:integrase
MCTQDPSDQRNDRVPFLPLPRPERFDLPIWYRTIVYNFILIMANTGMRTIEARNLRWRDVDARIDKQGRQFCCLNVRGKNKYRELVAPQSIATYFERIKEISKATGPDDPVFSTARSRSPKR